MAEYPVEYYPTIPTADEFAGAVKSRRRAFIICSAVLALISAGLMIKTDGNIALPIGLMMTVAACAIIATYPQALLPITLAGACMIELSVLTFKMPLTDRIPIFWDFNTIMQRYAGMESFHYLPLSPFEMLMILAACSWLVRGIYDHSITFRAGAMLIPILAYVSFVFIGLIMGLGSGGTFTTALFEVRAQFYFLFGYLMAMNGFSDPKSQIKTMFRIVGIAVGVKAFLVAIRYFTEQGGHAIPEVGVGFHEESFFFNAYILALAVLWMSGVDPKLQRWMLAGLPIVMLMNLDNQRRAATAAAIIALPFLMVLACVAFRERRKMLITLSLVVLALSAVYFPLFWNQSGSLAQPARALRSQFAPDERDRESNVYRDAEDANLLFTMKTSPVLGYGYGKPFIIQTPMVDLQDIDPLIHFIPHDQILWIWMRVGTLGFYAFWIMMALMLVLCGQVCRVQTYPKEVLAAAVYLGAMLIQLLVFGLLDMQLSNMRDMLFISVWVGTVAYARAVYGGEVPVEPAATPIAQPRRNHLASVADAGMAARIREADKR